MRIRMTAQDSAAYAAGDDDVLSDYWAGAAAQSNRLRQVVEVIDANDTLVITVHPAPPPRVPKTYLVAKCIGLNSISNGEKVWAFGEGFEYLDGNHRAHYNTNDAQAVCDWLNQRERGYAGVPA
jgi:hypothetical protein